MTSSEDGEAAVRLARFLSLASRAPLPEALQSFAKERLLDLVDALLSTPESRLRRMTDRLGSDPLGPARSTLWSSGAHGSVGSCAFANSMLAHTSARDDQSRAGHQGATVIPATLAVAEAEGCSGAEALTAIALAYEIQFRLASSSIDSLDHLAGDQGMHGATMMGAFGAVVAAALAMRLEEAEIARALSFAATLGAPGIVGPISRGGDEECLQVATNVRMGILAAQLARAGLAAAGSALEGVAGFYAAYTGRDGLPSEVLDQLGTRWLALAGVCSRPYPTELGNTGPVFCLLQILNSHQIRLEEVDRLEAFRPWWRRNTGCIAGSPFAGLDQALMSCRFALAATLVYGRYDWDTVLRALHDRRVYHWAQRVRVDGVATGDPTQGEVVVVTRDGERHRQRNTEMPDELCRPRFADVTERFLRGPLSQNDESRRREIVDAVAHFEQERSVSRLVGLLGS